MTTLNSDITTLKNLVKENETSKLEIFRFFRKKIEKLNPNLNALYGVDESALEKIENRINKSKNQYMFPMAVKELCEIEGEPTYYGSKAFEGNVASFSRDSVKCLLDKHFYLLGRATSCEFGLLPYTSSTLHGPTLNPWNLKLNSGGSSGGSAAAVASGMLPLAYGSDGGGSIRIPAAWCGCVGFKPSRGSLPQGPMSSFSFLSTGGLLSRSVRDQLEIYREFWFQNIGNDWTQFYDPYKDKKIASNEPIKVALMTNIPFEQARSNSTFNYPFHKEAIDQTRKFANSLEGLQRELSITIDMSERSFDFEDRDGFISSFITLWASSLTGLPSSSTYEPLTEYLLNMADSKNLLELGDAYKMLSMISKTLFKQFNEYDFIITPTMITPPPENKTIVDLSELTILSEGFDATPYTPWVNVMGLPAISIPFGYWKSGTPFGVQIIGTNFSNIKLLQFADMIESYLGYETKDGKNKHIAPLAEAH